MVESIWPLAGAKYNDISQEQYTKGMERYGVELTTFNGRNPFQDAMEELVDLSQYMTQMNQEALTMARCLYIFSIVYGFFDTLPAHVKIKLLETFADVPIASLCQMERINLDASTPKPYGPKTI
jgi:hypothetical protein